MDNKSNITFKPAKTQRASDVIYQQIYQKIVSGELKTGERLPAERELCEQFGRSRPSVREALRMLQQDGLINITVGTNGGAVVQGISLDIAEQPLRKLVDMGAISLQELANYRTYNDLCCAHLAVQNHTEKDVALLKDVIERYYAAVGNPQLFNELDIEFHKILAQASHNKLCILITDVVTTLCANMFWNVAATEMTKEELTAFNQKAAENHKNIAESIFAKDLERLDFYLNEVSDLFFNSVDAVL
ncbi:MAG: FadR family transcriptional regulator [Eubacterium sp.]|nr:FadR family transcriptional regulator [Eubacterium sp.]